MDGEKFKQIRKKLRITQTQLALILRARGGQSRIWRWESGESAIPGSVATIMEMLDAGELPQRYLTSPPPIDGGEDLSD